MSEHNLIDFINNLIECGRILIPCKDIKIIRALGKGVQIVTYEKDVFTDSNTTYEEFKKKLDNIKTCLPTKGKEPTSVSPLLGDGFLREKGGVPNIPRPISPPPKDHSEASPTPSTAPLQEVKPPTRIERVVIPIDNPALGSAQGHLPHTNIVDRNTILVTNSTGQVLGTGHPDGNGTIIGSNVSGIVFSAGNYRLVFKEYSAGEAYISYDVEG